MDQEPARLRRTAVRQRLWPCSIAAAVATRSAAFADLLRAVRRRLPGQRHRGSRKRSAASAQGAAADRVRRARRCRSPLAAAVVHRRRRAGGVALAQQAFGLVAAGYVAAAGCSTPAPLKHIVIIDVLTIAIGFVLRAVAGAVAIDVADQPLAARSARSCWRCSSRSPSGGTNWCCWPTARRAIGRFCGEYSPYPARSDDRRRHGVDARSPTSSTRSVRRPSRSSARAWLGLTIPFPLYGIFPATSISCTSARAAAVPPTCC